MNTNLTPDVAECLDLLRTMHLIRYTEEQLAEDFAAGKTPGGVHLSIGQEAVAAGVCAHLTDADQLASNHRGHGHFLAKGGDPKALFAEIYGKSEGICRGMGGSMHVADFSRGIIGANGIVGAGLPISTGAALADLLDDDGSITVCIFGDGASNQGVLQESLNFAALWQLPLLYVCEHNGFCQFSPAETVTAGTISDRAKPFGIPVDVCDGNDVRDVWRSIAWATEHIRSGKGPAFVEARTYRINNHFEREHLVVQTPYRTQEEIEEWRSERDPIDQLKHWLLNEKLADAAQLTDIDTTAKQIVQDSVAFGEAGTVPPEDIGSTYMFAGTYS
ncbi:MAG: thiamine pyrophosphate-dependent dehydrogenase E1 component subunit alpha [Gammaproteobacteria bacterium]|nr:thiamine pyrophosphate-dependent dehydrogenase E1 component subunit alpha [Gammaproteobacteria bacterium]